MLNALAALLHPSGESPLATARLHVQGTHTNGVKKLPIPENGMEASWKGVPRQNSALLHAALPSRSD